MPAAFEEIYTDEQREAMAEAYEDHRIRPASKVATLAEAGKLPAGIEPFRVHGGASTVRDCARKLRNRRAGKLASQTAKQNPRDAVEALRVRLLSAIDHELARVEREQRKRGGKADPEQLRQLGRALREAAAIPTRTEAPTPKPGHGPVSERVGGKTSPAAKTLAGGILRDVEAEGRTAHDLPQERSDGGDPAQPGVAHDEAEQENGVDDGSPGAYVREQIEQLASLASTDT